MIEPKFDQLFEQVALNLFATYQKSTGILPFLVNKLPARFGSVQGVLVNRKKEVSQENIILFDGLNCPKLPIDSVGKKMIVPAKYAYGSVSFFPEINQKSLEKMLQQNIHFAKVYENQSRDNSLDKKPLNIWLAKDLAPFLSLNDLEDRLLVEINPPDLVAVLNSGLLVTLNEKTIQNIFALAEKENTQSFDRTITADLLDIAQKTIQHKYFKIGASAVYKNYFFFYILLLDLLKNQTLLNDGLSAEMVSIW